MEIERSHIANLDREAYERGLKDGQIMALEAAVQKAHSRMDELETRIGAQERISYAVMGVIAFINVLPVLKETMGAG